MNFTRWALASCLFLVPLQCPAATLCVWTNSPFPGAPYNEWTNAARDIQTAVDAAVNGDTVLVTNGVYDSGGALGFGALTARVVATKSITIVSVNGPSNTFIVGKGPPGDAAVRCAALSAGATLVGFTLSNGFTRVSGDWLYDRSGGGVLGLGGTVSNCIVRANMADYCGGGFAGMGVNLIVDCVLETNAAPYGGGGYQWKDGLRVQGCTMSHNTAHAGGGLYVEDSPGALVSGCLIHDNRAEGRGGGIRFDPSGALSNCVVYGNYTGSDGAGIAIYSGGTGDVIACAVFSNRAVWAGGGLYFSGFGTVRDSVFHGNEAGVEGGGLRINGNLPYGIAIRGCLLYNNTAGAGGGGLYFWNLGMVENCTIAGNGASGYGGGAYAENWDVMFRNCIIYGNHGSAWSNIDYVTGDATFSNCCTAPLPADGSGNITADPRFVDPSANNYRVNYATSPCVDAGTNAPWMDGAFDLDGKPRIYGASVDIGAYEAQPSTNLGCDFVSDIQHALAPVTAVFQAQVFGPNTNITWYGWDWNGDGTVEAQGATLQQATNTFAAGYHAVSLTVSNAAGDTAICTKPSYIKSVPLVLHVAMNGTHVAPFTNWVTAAHNIQDAVNAAVDGCTVLVTNGSYGATAQVTLDKGIAVRSVNGWSNTVCYRAGAAEHRLFHLSHSNAVVDGLTISNGAQAGAYPANSGGGVLIYPRGTVQNCLIDTCSASLMGGGAMLIEGGVLASCVVAHCVSSDQGGGIFCQDGGEVRNCVSRDNTAVGSGGGACMDGGSVLRNCLIYGNSAAGGGGGLACFFGGTVINCTIARNTAMAGKEGGGVLTDSGGSFVNSIIYSNVASASREWVSLAAGATYDHCCTWPLPAGANNITNAPQFANAGGLDFHLTITSPCVDAGTHTNAPDRDIQNIPRPLDGNNDGTNAYDMGAYEFVHPDADSDSDWLKDTNELAIGTSPILPDTDGDHMTDGAEVLAGTDPLDIASFLGLTAASRSGAGLVVRWSSAAGRYYRLDRSSNLVTDSFATRIATNIAATAPQNVYTDTTAVGTGPRLYRVELE